MNLLEPQPTEINYHKVRWFLESEIEASLLAVATWWAEGMSLKIKLKGWDPHQISAKPYRKRKPTLVDLRNALLLPGIPPLDHNFLMESFKAIVWNCRGAGNTRFKSNFTEMIRHHKPDVVALLETKVSLQTMGAFFENMGFTRNVFSDPEGRAGGIWVLWDPSRVSVDTISVNPQVIHVKIQRNGYADWVLSALYAKPNPRLKEILWEGLKDFAAEINHPWAVIGDYNDIANVGESRSIGPDNSHSQRRKFSANINECKLMEIGASGPKFTWSNGRQGNANIQKRLDRGLCNEEWQALFPEGNLKLNTDGCWYERNRNAGFGGLVRNDQGEWQIGYYGKMLASSSLETEIWSIYRGLTIILEKGWTNVQIESDSQIAVTLFTEGTNATHPQSNILNDGKFLLNRTRSNIVHIYRGANECADCLAHLGASQNGDLVVAPIPPLAVREAMIRESLNLHHVLD